MLAIKAKEACESVVVVLFHLLIALSPTMGP